MQFKSLFGIPVDLRTPHRFTPMKQYASILKFIREKRIHVEDMINGRIKPIYEKIIFAQNNFILSLKWGRIHCNVLPNYLKTFNFKLSKKILPCKTNFVEFGLDTNSRCNFCFLHPDTVPHVFSQCLVLAPIWRILDLGLKQLNIDFCFTTSRQIYDYDLRNSVLKTQENFIIYLNTVTNYMWYSIRMQKTEITTRIST